MAHGSLRLRDDLHFELRYHDRTPFGSAVSGQSDAFVRKVCRPVFQGFRRLDRDEIRSRTGSLLARCFDSQHLGALYERPGRLHTACAQPAPDLVLPAALRLFVAGEPRGSVPLAPSVAKELARWCADFALPGTAPRSPGARALWDALRAADVLWDAPLRTGCVAPGMQRLGATSVVLPSGGARLCFDPALSVFASEALRVTPPDAVFVSHSHAEQFCPASLLGLSPDTPIHVPEVPHESLLSVDMAARLCELGFRNVHCLGWGQTVQVGTSRVTAHPLWGDQPSDGEVLHPELANLGNTYWVDDGRLRFAWLADAGRDRRGTSFEQAGDLSARDPRTDLVFANFRPEPLWPVEHLAIGLARHLLFIPPSAWTRSMHQVATPDVLYATARRLGANVLVPLCRDGGQPFVLSLERAGQGPRIQMLCGLERLPEADPSQDRGPEVPVALASRSRPRTARRRRSGARSVSRSG